MSEAVIFEFPYNLFLKQRLEFVVICSDHLEASIMRIVEYEMLKLKETWQGKVALALETKQIPPKEPKEYWARLSQGQIIAKLYMYDSAKLEKPEDEDTESEAWLEYRRKKALSISKSTLRKAIDRLIEKGFLKMRSKPGDEFGAPLYTLHRTNVQNALKALPSNPFTIFHTRGVSNFESGGESQILKVPPPNFESGESQDLEVPVAEVESPQLQILQVNKDITEDTFLDIEQDTEEREDTHTQSVTSDTSSSLENEDESIATDQIPVSTVSYSQEDTRNSIANDVTALMEVRETIDTRTEQIDKHISDKHPVVAQHLYGDTESHSDVTQGLMDEQGANGYEKEQQQTTSVPVKGAFPPHGTAPTSDASESRSYPRTMAQRASGDEQARATAMIGSGERTDETVRGQNARDVSREGTTNPVSSNKTHATGGNKNSGKGKTSQVEKPQLTLRGQQIHEWMEALQGTRIRRTAGNVTACNELGDNEDVLQESLELTYKLLINLSWVKEHDYPIDVQVLADEKSKLNFERNWPVAKRRRQRTNGNGHSPTASGTHNLSTTDVDNDTVARSAFDVYVGNGPEERAALQAQVEALRAQGLIPLEDLL